MKIMIPNPVTALTAPSIPETDYPAWSSGTTYAKGTLVIMTSTHRIYQSLADANLGNQPDLTCTGTSPKWVDVGPTNQWAMFDSRVSTASVALGSIEVEFDVSRCNALALFNLFGATSVRVRQKYAGSIIKDEFYDLTMGNSTSWSDYFFRESSFKSQLYLPLLLNYSSTALVTITGGGEVSCGWIGAGLEKYLGKSRFGLQVGILDYSKKSTDTWGNTYLSKGEYAKKMTGDLYLRGWDITGVFNALASVRGTPVVWCCDNSDANQMDGLIFLGFFKDFQIVIQAAAWKTCYFEVEGLV